MLHGYFDVIHVNDANTFPIMALKFHCYNALMNYLSPTRITVTTTVIKFLCVTELYDLQVLTYLLHFHVYDGCLSSRFKLIKKLIAIVSTYVVYYIKKINQNNHTPLHKLSLSEAITRSKIYPDKIKGLLKCGRFIP